VHVARSAMDTDTSAQNQPVQAQKISGEMRRADLLDAALNVFAEKGYDGASLQDIAERIGILKGSVYYYYKSKEDILFDVVKFVHDLHLENARSLVAAQGDPLDRLRFLLEGHAIFVCRNLDRATVFLREMDRLPPERQAEILGPDHSYQRVFRDAIVAAQKAGQVAAEVNPKLASLWILGALNWLHRWYRPDRSNGPEQVAAQFADQLTRGVAASPLWSRQR
jgi:AcrR family transcriptional regulator